MKNKIFILFFCFFYFNSYSVSYQLNNFITITSKYQFINLEKNIVFFIGNVLLTENKIKIFAEKIIIYYYYNNFTITILGNPVKFYQKKTSLKNNIQGHANKVYYDTNKKYLKFIGNVYINNFSKKIKSDYIIYFIKNKNIQIFSKNKNINKIIN